ncbi:AsmA family protein [Sandaracinobacteroides hominis]|uniref:AsmA family protein n=1 Tax=Sandaracinobacteroides hominis TaxID=2780086 RepID=UPI001F19CF03|nr:AsmA family protein [Sandaracinobacteroides hominis]
MNAEFPFQREELIAAPNRALRILRNLLIGLFIAVFTVWLALFLTKGRFLKPPFEQIASSMAEREVQVGGDFQLYFAPFDIKFLAERLSVSNPDWASKDHLLAAERIETRIAPLSLLFGSARLHWLELRGADIDLEWDATHRFNSWTFKGAGKPL